MADWYPAREDQLIPWHTNFVTQAGLHAATFPVILGAPVLAAIAVNRDVAIACVNAATAAPAYSQEVTAWKEILLRAALGTPVPAVPTLPPAPTVPLGTISGVEAYTRRLASQLRADAAYNQAIGESLGIVGAAPGPPGTPTVSAIALTQSQVQLNLGKAGYGVLAVDSRRGGGGWEQIGVATTSPYIDARAPLVAGQPELREYRDQGMENNARVGPLSAISSAVTVP